MNTLLQKTLLLVTLSFLFVGSTNINAQTHGKNGMVVSDNALASEVGIEILKKGGNAVDAAIATAFALAVTHPEAGNIGGGGFLVFLDVKGKVTTIDFREKAPLLATKNMFLDSTGSVPENEMHNTVKSVGVPGTVAGLYLAHQKYGKLSWKVLVQPAIDMAEKGFPLTWTLHRHAQFIKENIQSELLSKYFLNKKGELIQPGEKWTQQNLANTLKLIRDNGHDGFYKGAVANEIARYMKANGGLITLKDLEKYKAVERQPVKGTYKEYEIFSMAPPSSGGIALLEMLNMMEAANLDSIAFNSAAYVHLLTEVMRRAFADRAEHIGDPDFNTAMPVTKLISKEFGKMRFKTIDQNKASASDSSKFGQVYESTNTTHFSVTDKDGNAVSLTYTLEGMYGSTQGSQQLGFIFNNEMGDFNPAPGFTNAQGMIGTKPNIIEPEKRMLSSMTPTIITKNGKLFLVIGSPGGRTIINTVFQAILNVLEYKMPIAKAIEAMKIHHQWLPDEIFFEKDLMSPDSQKLLIAMGHKLTAIDNLGVLMGIMYDIENKVYIGAAESSSADGAAIGY